LGENGLNAVIKQINSEKKAKAQYETSLKGSDCFKWGV